MDDDMFLATVGFILLCLVALIVLDDEEEQNDGPNVEELAECVGAFRRMRKRAFDGEDDQPPPKRKKYDCERACNCLAADHTGPDPLFSAHHERTFRVTRGIAERSLQACGMKDFFTHKKLLTGEMGTCPEVKVHMALKTLAFGCSSTAFVDCFQMSITSGRDCVREFARCIANSELKQQCLRKLTKADARKTSALHEREFGIAGCAGCLDCMHVFWKNCPAAWQGLHKGKEGAPAVVLEGLSDCNLWIWHLAFGFPGALNDINIWDQSSLLRAFLDGAFASYVDFMHTIGDTVFNRSRLFVDGICPELSRFVETPSVPMTKKETTHCDWQESSRKSVERAFGVAQRKFQIPVRPMELWHEDDIQNIVEACFIIHGVMVENRLAKDQQEGHGWCHLAEEEETEEQNNNDDEVTTADDGGDDDEFLGRHSVDVDNSGPANEPSLNARVAQVSATWPMGGSERAEAIKSALDDHFEEAEKAWDDSHDNSLHMHLRHTLIKAVDKKQFWLNNNDWTSQCV